MWSQDWSAQQRRQKIKAFQPQWLTQSLMKSDTLLQVSEKM